MSSPIPTRDKRYTTDTLRNQTYAICSYPVLFPTSAETVWEGYEKPKGDVNIPSTVEYNGQAYSVADVGRCVFIYCDSITSINVPENVFKLGNGSMAYCSNLKTVKLPSTLTEIDRLAFINDSLETIVLACTTPPSIRENAFKIFDATLYVPAGTADAYRQHEVWGRFANIVEGDPTGIKALKDDDIKIYARNGRIVVDGADGENVQVFNMNGQEIPATQNLLPNGIYLVKVANRPAQKVSVRM